VNSDTHPRSRRALAGPSLRFNLLSQLEKLREEPEWRATNHNAITLLKDPGLGLILMVLGNGHKLDEHRAAGTIAVQVLSGQVRFTIAGEEITLGSGELVTMEKGTPHDLCALEDSTLLLIIGGRRKAE
jgi:quercetin dioxygenase-like cupin family protein